MRKTAMMRALPLLVLLSSVAAVGSAEANENYEHIVKRGEAWDWHDVLRQSDLYHRWRGIGLADFLATTNGYSSSEKLPFGKTVAILPLDQLVASANFPRELESSVSVIVEARKLAVALEICAGRNCNGARVLSDEERTKARQSAIALDSVALELGTSFPRASTQVKRAGESMHWIASRGRRRVTYKGTYGILNRTGWALHRLHLATKPKLPVGDGP